MTSTEVTLHVGAGTFKPVQTDSIEEHEMHTEFFSVSADTLRLLMENHEKIVAVGTTTLRTLESLYWIGIKLNMDYLKSTICFISINGMLINLRLPFLILRP